MKIMKGSKDVYLGKKSGWGDIRTGFQISERGQAEGDKSSCVAELDGVGRAASRPISAKHKEELLCN